MTNQKKKNESIRCACGKVDLYEEWLKQNEGKEKNSTPTSQTDNQIRSSNAAGKGDTEQVQTKE